MTKKTTETEVSAVASDPKSDAVSEALFTALCETAEIKYGHGWKRRVSRSLGVPETTFQSWLKAGKPSPTAELLVNQKLYSQVLQLRLNELRRAAERDTKRGRIVRATDGTFDVYNFASGTGIGTLVAARIPTHELAERIANINLVASLLEQMCEIVANMESWEASDWSVTGIELAESDDKEIIFKPFALKREYLALGVTLHDAVGGHQQSEITKNDFENAFLELLKLDELDEADQQATETGLASATRKNSPSEETGE